MGIENKVYFVRHAQTKQNVRIDIQRDPLLTSQGIEQARLAGEQIKGMYNESEPKVIIHTGLIRTRETAQIINDVAGFHSPLIEKPEFRERDMGMYEGVPFEAVLKKNPEMHLLYKQYGSSCVWYFEDEDMNVERMVDFKERVASGLTDLMTNYARDSVLVVGHSGSIKVVRYVIEKIQTDFLVYMSSYVPNNCEIYEINFE